MKLKIINKGELIKDLETYKKMFPSSFKTLDNIEENLRLVAGGAGTGQFGLSVSSEWPDKCYLFECMLRYEEEAFFEYLGLSKC